MRPLISRNALAFASIAVASAAGAMAMIGSGDERQSAAAPSGIVAAQPAAAGSSSVASGATTASTSAGAGTQALVVAPGASFAQVPANPNAGPKTTQVLQWLSSLQYRTTHKFLTGQFVSPNYGRPEKGFPTVQDAWNYHIENLKTQTGKAPALVGFDLTNREFLGANGVNLPGCSNIQTLSKSFADSGGIVTLSWHASNPWTGANAWSAVPAGHSLIEATQTGTAANTQYMQWLSAVGDCIKWYSDNRITVVFRPFHEMNAGQFWWGTSQSPADYVALWRHMYNYLTVTRGLNNILWVWSPNSYTFDANTTDRYPGDAYVDILGHERYAVNLTRTDLYNWMVAKNKVILFSEAGKPSSQTTPWDTNTMLNEVRGNYPKVVGGMLWMKTTVDFSIYGNLNASTFMNDPMSVTLDDMPGTITDDAAAAITYTGTWTHSADNSYYAATKSVSNAPGSTATLAFTGTSIAVFGKQCPACGKFDVYVDNLLRASVNAAAPSEAWGVKFAQVDGLAAGSHTVQLRLPAPNGYVGIDYFSVK